MPLTRSETSPRGLPEVETGTLSGHWPFAKVGSGTNKLLVFPGIHDALADVTVNPRFAAWFCRELAFDRTVYMISRRDQLPVGFGVREMADDYALVVAEHFERPDILGVSMGSAIAQEFAVGHPELTGHLALATVGCRLPPDKRPVCEHWIELARREAWRELFLDLVDNVYGRNRRAVFQAILPQTDSSFFGRSAAANDFIVSVEACLDFDTSQRVAGIQSPTLVIGGEADLLTPARELRDLAARINGAECLLLQGAGHGVFEERKEEFDGAIVKFLSARSGS